MSKKRRFYQFKYTNTGDPMFFEDMGNTLKIGGMLLEGMGSQVLVIAPTGTMPRDASTNEISISGESNFLDLPIIKPSLEEWSEILRQSDDAVYFTEDDTGMKHIHRRQRMAISGAVQQRIWIRDGLKCVFCLRPMGEVQLTVDHFIPLESGGENNPGNYISCCRRCNKDKGNQDAREYCDRVGVNYGDVIFYMSSGDTEYRGIRYLDTVDSIRAK